MKSIVGLLEYTVTGAFVWILFVLAFAWVSVDAKVSQGIPLGEVWAALQSFLSSVPSEVTEPAGLAKDILSYAVVGTLLVAVFTTGALLDLVAPVAFVVLEIGWAQKWMFRRSHTWLDQLIDEEGALVAADYAALVGPPRQGKRPSQWQPLKYRRVTTFLLSHMLSAAKPGQIEDFMDSLKLWRVNEAICLALFVLALGLAGRGLFVETRDSFLVSAVVPSFLAVLAYVSMRIGFFRMVTALESALYVGFVQSRRAGMKVAAHAAIPQPPAGAETSVARLWKPDGKEAAEG